MLYNNLSNYFSKCQSEILWAYLDLDLIVDLLQIDFDSLKKSLDVDISIGIQDLGSIYKIVYEGQKFSEFETKKLSQNSVKRIFDTIFIQHQISNKSYIPN